jgi:hypothetical protein
MTDQSKTDPIREALAKTIMRGLGIFSDVEARWSCGGAWPDACRSAADAVLGLPQPATVDRAAVIEECAKIADMWIRDFGAVETKYLNAQRYAVDAVMDISAAIRDLATKTGKQP